MTDAPDASAATEAKRSSSLRFSSTDGLAGGGGKRKSRIYGQEDGEADNDGETFDDLVKRAKTDPAAATQSDIKKRRGVLEKPMEKPEGGSKQGEGKKAPLTKEEKAAMKAKRKAAKKMLSFED